MSRTVAIIGAGMAGLAAATRLRKSGVAVTVFEAGAAAGGRAETVSKDGYLLDTGAITLSPGYREAIALLREAGAGNLLETIRPVLAIARGGQLHEIDLERPLRSLAAMRLLSARSLPRFLKLLPQLARTWRRSDFTDMGKLAAFDTENCREYAMRVLGKELHDFVIDPLIRVNMFTDTAASSVVDLFWLLKISANPTLVQVQGGMAAMGAALSASLDVRYNSPVDSVSISNGKALVVRGADEALFDAAIVATDPPAAVRLTPGLDTPQRRWLASLRPVRSITVQIGVRTPPASRATMIMVPSGEAADVLAVVLDHNKCADRAPPGMGLVTLHMSSAWRERHGNSTEDVMLASALEAVQPVLGNLTDQVEMAHFRRWDFVDNERPVGTYRALAEAGFDRQRPPIIFAGASVASGIEAAVISGNRAAAIVAAI